jgi:hypothetical protein
MELTTKVDSSTASVKAKVLELIQMVIESLDNSKMTKSMDQLLYTRPLR